MNATLRDSTLRQDEKYKEDITKLHRRRERLNDKLKHLREIDQDLTREIELCAKTNKKMGVKSVDPNGIDEWNIHRDVERILIEVSVAYLPVGMASDWMKSVPVFQFGFGRFRKPCGTTKD